MSELSTRPPRPVVGVEMPHESADLHVTGLALYTDDLVSRYPGVLHAYPVQAPHAHAQVRALDTAPALAVPGVVHVLTAADVPGVNDAGVKHDEPLFPSEVMYYGHPVCWVLAETLEAARIGATKVAIEYDPLPSLITIKEAIAAESYQGSRPVLRRGDPEAAFPGCAHVFEGEFEFAGQEHFYLETNAALASIDENGQIFVQSSTQHPTETQDIVSHVLGKPYHEVTVQCLRMGGGFGGKEMQPHGYAAIAALGTVVTGRPVRVRFNRTQDITISGKRHGFHAVWKVGFAEDGTIQALTGDADRGRRLEPGPVRTGAGPRPLPHRQRLLDPEHRGARADLQDQQDLADRVPRVRRAAGHDRDREHPRPVRARAWPERPRAAPAQLLHGRADHPVRPGRCATRSASSGPGARCWRPATWIGGWSRSRRSTPPTSTPSGRWRITPVKFGISFNLTAFNQAGALVHVYKDGSVLINHGGTEMGQGLHTKMLQVAATALGVPLSIVRLAPTRTDKVPNTSATAASSGADLNGGAVKNACEQIKARLAEVAAEELGVHPADVRFVDGKVTGLGVDRELIFAELVNLAYHQRVQLWAAGFYRTAGLHWDAKHMHGSPFKYFAYGVAASEVEVDGFTGAYRLRRVDIVHDVGDSLSPLVDLGQVEGGFVQGAGWLTLEDLRWDTGDGPSRGRLATQAASTYKLPSFSEMPEVFNVALLEKAHEDGAVYGSKAVGEPPLMLAFSVREALREAVAAFGPTGHCVDLGCPSTPEQVFWAIQRARSTDAPMRPTEAPVAQIAGGGT